MKVGIIGAMDVEVEHLVSELEEDQPFEHFGRVFHDGVLHGVPAVVAMCGDGKVNAALCAQTLIDRFGVTCVINTGIAGSLDNRINIGDLVVSTDALHHDADLTPLGYEPGFIPSLDTVAFAADDELRELVVRVAHEVAPEIGVYEGRVASGDQFISSVEQKHRIVETFGAICAEMEGAAIGHVCHLARIPFVIIRVISDKADEPASVDYPTFKQEAALHCSQIVEHVISQL